MAMFYDWRDRTGKGWKSWREYLDEIRSPVFIGIGILLLFSVAVLVAVYFGYWRSPEIESERVYLPPDPSEQRAVISETVNSTTPAAITSNDRLDLDATDTAQDDTTEVVSDAVSTAIEVETAWEIDPENTTVIEPTIAELEAIDAETERLLVEGDMIAAQAMETMKQAVPIVVNHLNALSAEDQQAFLDHVKSQIFSYAPPELQKIYAQNPELKDKGYDLFLEMLRENGFESR